MRAAYLLLLVVILAPLAPAVRGADEDEGEEAARRYARERLLREARLAVGASLDRPAPLASVKKAIQADMCFLTSYEPKTDEERALKEAFRETIEERILLAGAPGDAPDSEDEDPGGIGALQEARGLYGWLDGKEQCAVEVWADATVPEDKRPYFPYPPLPPEPEVVKSDPDAVPAAGPGLDVAPAGPPPPADGEEPATEAPAEGDAAPEDAPAKPSAPEAPKADEPKEPPPPPPAPPKPEEWARDVVRPSEAVGGVLLGKQIQPKICTTVDRLLAAAKRKPVLFHREVGPLVRHAVVAKDVFAYNVPYVALRLLQKSEMLAALQKDVPVPGLVDESTVREKASRAARLRKVVERLKTQRARVVNSLDAMALDIDGWKTQAALLAREIEDEKKRIVEAGEEAPGEGESDGGEDERPAPPAPEPPPVKDGGEATPQAAPAPCVAPDAGSLQGSLVLRLAEAREGLVSLDLRLLYVTAVRAQRRIELLDRLISAAEDESTAAELVQNRFQEELVRLRNERRLDRLRSDERLLERWIAAETPQAGAEDAPPASPRLGAYEAVLAVVNLAQEAVLRRRALTGRGTAREAQERAIDEPVVTSTPPDAPADAKSEAPPEEAVAGKHLTQLLRYPDKATWDLTYVELAHAELADPDLAIDFDAHLVAAHYAAADGRIGALWDSLAATGDEHVLTARFDETTAAAQQALEPFASDYLLVQVRRLPGMVKAAQEDFRTALEGIATQRERNYERLLALKKYARELLRQGTRSLLIRQDRDLDTADLEGAAGEVTTAVDDVGHWITLQSEEHAGHWLKGAWPRLLGLLAIVGILFWGIRFFRRRVDRWITREAQSHPKLRELGASVRAEREEAERRREAEDLGPEADHEALLRAGAEPSLLDEELEKKAAAEKSEVRSTRDEGAKREEEKR